MKKPRFLIVISSNRVTCGSCGWLEKFPARENASGSWWCGLFGTDLGYVGAMKTPNRQEPCLTIEHKAREQAGA